jgi:Family of unknown function (DUF6879)
LTPEEFDACFDRFQTDVFRLEILQRYNIPEEDERIQAWRDGLPRPDRSVRTSPWLRRIAVTTAADKRWCRIHLVDHPLTDYLKYQIVGYVESAAAGEEIRIADRAMHSDLQAMEQDFWLFDADGPAPYAVLMNYDDDCRWTGADYTEDPAVIQACKQQRETALRLSTPLNIYVAEAMKGRLVA